MDRALMLDRLRAEPDDWDVIVVGGGATGLGAAVDAASRGYRTLLLEQSDFAKGTSSRSTKLIHGGVRYLRQGNVALVVEALRERGRLIRNAPHLVRDLAFVVPAYDWWEGPFYGAGLKLYDLLSGRAGITGSKFLSREETLAQIRTLESDGLRGGVRYHDAQFDDARMAVTLARTAADLGACVLNYCRVTALQKRQGLVCGVHVTDIERGVEMAVQGKAVINATGVFVDDIRRLDDEKAPPLLALSQGIHLVLDRSFLPGDAAMLVPATDDGRVLFAVPWLNRVLLGTTDTPVGRASLEPRALEEEVEYLLRYAARYLTRDPRPSDVLSVFSGLRPLVSDHSEDTASIAREHTVVVAPSGLVTITGGKWTTYRSMGEDAVDHAAEVGNLPDRPSGSRKLLLHGATTDRDPDPELAPYGADAPTLRQWMQDDPPLRTDLHPRLPYKAVHVIWAVREEMARTVEDVLARRTRSLLLDAVASAEAAPAVAAILARERDLSETWQMEQIAAYRALAGEYVLPGAVTAPHD